MIDSDTATAPPVAPYSRVVNTDWLAAEFAAYNANRAEQYAYEFREDGATRTEVERIVRAYGEHLTEMWRCVERFARSLEVRS